jgi:hypothetical protein
MQAREMGQGEGQGVLTHLAVEQVLIDSSQVEGPSALLFPVSPWAGNRSVRLSGVVMDRVQR